LTSSNGSPALASQNTY